MAISESRAVPDAAEPGPIEEYRPYLMRYALLQLRDATAAEDVVQETLLAALQARTRYAGRSSVKTWLTGILKHKIIDLTRRQMREQVLDHESLPQEPGMDEFFANDDGHWVEKPQFWAAPEDELEQKQFLLILQQCMDRLPDKLARIFLMREVQEIDNEEICKELEISTTNAWVMLYRARMGLRKCLELNWLGK